MLLLILDEISMLGAPITICSYSTHNGQLVDVLTLSFWHFTYKSQYGQFTKVNISEIVTILGSSFYFALYLAVSMY